MKMAKKLLCIMLAMVMVFTFAACSGGDDDPPSTTNDDPVVTPDVPGPAVDDDPIVDDPGTTVDPDAPAERIIYDNSGYNGPWPDFNDYVPFSYDMTKVIYATSFDDESEICTCEEPRECGGDNKCHDGAAIWRRRWDPGRTISPMVDGERVNTTVHEFYGDMILEISSDFAIHGDTSLLVANRSHDWNGATLDITDFILNNESEYECFVWVKMPPGADAGRVLLSAQTNGPDGELYRGWADYGIVYEDDPYHASKYWFPIETYLMGEDGTEANPGEDAEYNIPYIYEKDGWVLLRGTTAFVKIFFDQIQVYVETKEGHPNRQPIYMDCFTIMLAH
jgi:hypothetical protein